MKKKGYMRILSLFGVAVGTAFWNRKNKIYEENLQKYGDKFYEYFQLLNRWMIARNEKKQIADFFHEEHISKIAVYGMGELANRLFEELEGSDIQILYGIDRDICCTNSRIADVYYPDDVLPEVDAIVITPFLSADGIKKDLIKKCSCKLLSLDNIIYTL